MGVTAVLALLMTIIAYIAQSPRTLLRLGLAAHRLDLRVKSFTGYALASLILLLGFFLAGVPINAGDATITATPNSETANISPTLVQTDADTATDLPAAVSTTNTSRNGDSSESSIETPSSGAFGGPPPGSSDEQVTETPSPTATPEQAGPSPTPDDESEATAVSPTPTDNEAGTAVPTASPTATATPFPTATPSPTITPTPIEGITGTINTNGSTLWVRRSPGGQQLVIVQDNEIVLLENGRANQGGILWREIRTLTGVRGWLQMEFLLDEE